MTVIHTLDSISEIIYYGFELLNEKENIFEQLM